MDIVPASRTILIKLADPAIRHRPDSAWAACGCNPDQRRSVPSDRSTSTIDVVYDGADLNEVREPDRADPRPGGRGAHRHAVAGRLRWASRPGSPTSSAAMRGSRCRAGPSPRTSVPPGAGGAGRRVQRHLPAAVARRLAADRRTDAGAFRRRPRTTRAALAGHVGCSSKPSTVGEENTMTTTMPKASNPGHCAPACRELEILAQDRRPGRGPRPSGNGASGRHPLGCRFNRRPGHTLANRLVANPGEHATITR